MSASAPVEGVFNITLLNVSSNSIQLDSREHLGHLINSDNSISVIEPGSTTTVPNVEENLVFGGNLSNAQKDRMSSLVSRYKDISASNPKKPNLVKNMEHRIITNDAQPVNRKPYRVPYAWNAEMDQQIQEMVQNDIIRPSFSPWNAPIILVKKKDNTMRFVAISVA